MSTTAAITASSVIGSGFTSARNSALGNPGLHQQLHSDSATLQALTPNEAWARVQSGEAELVDVRSIEELKADGHVPGAQHVAWQIGPALLKNVRFTRELEKKVSKQAELILLCRSGVRSLAAAEAAKKAGYSQVSYVIAGIEGESNGGRSGWRQLGLPLVQG